MSVVNLIYVTLVTVAQQKLKNNFLKANDNDIFPQLISTASFDKRAKNIFNPSPSSCFYYGRTSGKRNDIQPGAGYNRNGP